MFDPISKLVLGLLTGIIFGFLLQKGRAAKFHVIIGQFLLKDWTVVKIMATAVAVGTIGVYALVSMGAATLHIKPALLGGVLLGGLLFGTGRLLSRHFGRGERRRQARRDGWRGGDALRRGHVRRVISGAATDHQGSRRLGQNHAAAGDESFSVGMDRRGRNGNYNGAVHA